MSEQDIDYYRQRAETELKIAQAATCEEARKVHYTLAGHYLDRATGNDGELPLSSVSREGS